MCSIFGSNISDINKLKKLAIEGEVRGKDATGIATIKEGVIEILKGDVKASKLDYSKLKKGDFYLGHTRKTTQGNESDNHNNHPFISEDNTLLLAHNGIISNDKNLWTYKTKIETDSFTIMQQLEKEKGKKSLTINNVKNVCEKLMGSFALSIFDITTNKLFLLRHSNPLKILYNAKSGDLIYASLTDMIRKSYGNECNYNTFIGEIEEDLIYEFNLNTKKFTNQKEFTAKTYQTTVTNYYGKYNTQSRLERYFDKVKEKFNLTNMQNYFFDNKDTYAFSVSMYEKCDFCGVYYRNDDYVKAGLIKEGIHFCAYCWEGEQETKYKEHKITDKQLELAQKEKSDLQKKELIEGSEYPRAKLTESKFLKLDRKEQLKYIYCSNCKKYYYEDYGMIFYDNNSKTYKCNTCFSEEIYTDKTEVS